MWTSPKRRPGAAGPPARGRGSRRGSALLAVLWLSAALAAIAFSLANTVRGEVDRAATSVDSARSYYMAVAGIQRAALLMAWRSEKEGYRIPAGASVLPFSFPGGEVLVELIPEAAKLNINTIRPEDLFRLVVALGVDEERAREITLAIVDWRSPVGEPSAFDEYYLSISPTFRARHASLEETEELLLVKGVTPEIYYGTWGEAAAGEGRRLAARQGLGDCVSVFGAPHRVDANTAPAPVLAAVGIPPELIGALIERRRQAPFTKMEELMEFAGNAEAVVNRLRLGGGSIYTLRATARLRLADGHLSDLKRSVAAQIKFSPGGGKLFEYLRWYDMAWTN